MAPIDGAERLGTAAPACERPLEPIVGQRVSSAQLAFDQRIFNALDAEGRYSNRVGFSIPLDHPLVVQRGQHLVTKIAQAWVLDLICQILSRHSRFLSAM